MKHNIRYEIYFSICLICVAGVSACDRSNKQKEEKNFVIPKLVKLSARNVFWRATETDVEFLVWINNEPVKWERDHIYVLCSGYPIRNGENSIDVILTNDINDEQKAFPWAETVSTHYGVMDDSASAITNSQETFSLAGESRLEKSFSVNISGLSISENNFELIGPDDRAKLPEVAIQFISLYKNRKFKKLCENYPERAEVITMVAEWVEQAGEIAVSGVDEQADLRIEFGDKFALVYPSRRLSEDGSGKLLEIKDNLSEIKLNYSIHSIIFYLMDGEWKPHL